jgi:hypothetical protein
LPAIASGFRTHQQRGKAAGNSAAAHAAKAAAEIAAEHVSEALYHVANAAALARTALGALLLLRKTSAAAGHGLDRGSQELI